MRRPLLLLLLVLGAGACGGNPTREAMPSPAAMYTSQPPVSCRDAKSCVSTAIATEMPPGEMATPTVPVAGQTIRNEQNDFTLFYPEDWMVTAESEDSLTLLPRAEEGWEPATPLELFKDPAVTVLVGEAIAERAGPSFFPVQVDPASLRRWLEEKVASGEGQSLREFERGGFRAYQITEIGESDCDEVVYWRALDLARLVRLSTGCESDYLDGFQRIVETLRPLSRD